MGSVTGVTVYLMVWWMVLFMVLPWRVTTPTEPQPGSAPSAPDKPYIWLKMAITTVISAVIWLIIYVLVESEWISFRTSTPFF